MTATLEEICIEPVHLGPTWERNPEWDGVGRLDEFILPSLTLGWQVLQWIRDNLLGDEVDDDGKPLPFKPTFEQSRFILWWYAIDERGRFAYREGVLQRLKGWGKDPLAAVLAAVEFIGPCRFAGWATRDMPELGLKRGDPVARSNRKAWIQIAAVSKDQTKNTMTIFSGIFPDAVKKEHNIDMGKEVIYAYDGQRRIEVVTSSPRSLEGNRPTFVIKNETHHWLENNQGHEMASAIRRNATKAKGGAARTLSITNAYEPGEDSVAERERKAFENVVAGLSWESGRLYDSLEASSDTRLEPKVFDEHGRKREATEQEVKDHLTAVVTSIRGDAVWLDVEGIVQSMMDRVEPISTLRRFWFNQVVAADDAWADPIAVEAAIDHLAKSAREMISRTADNILRAGWLVQPDEEIVSFFDGSKSDDATALMGCRLSDGYTFTIGVWQKPRGKRGKTWLAPRAEVDQRVDEMFRRFNVVAFWADPSHTADDEDQTRYWDGYIDEWMRKYKDRLRVWPTKSGHGKHAIMFDMASPERHRLFVEAAERVAGELHTLNDIEEYEPEFKIDGHPALLNHLGNAKRYNHKFGVTLMKENRESPNKIDLAVCLVGARMLRRIVLNEHEEEESRNGEVWGAW